MGLTSRLNGGEAGAAQGGFVEGMRVIIDTFVGDLVSVSRDSMKVVEQTQLMSGDVDELLKNTGKLEELASTTRIIALNAEIEANRTRAGQVFRVVAAETKRLAREASHFSEQVRTSVERCQQRLAQTQSIVTLLASHDMTIALGAQANLSSTVQQIDTANRELLSTLGLLDEQVNAAMTALQFDDILSQLLASIDRRILLMEEVWLDSLTPGVAKDAVEGMLQAFESRRDRFEQRQVVNQTSVDSGTVELFSGDA
ncbi:MAG: hypothetical protein QM817_21185 [Archangium sp.]